MFLVVGLGNPGEKYEKTRHNAGRLVLDAFLNAHNFLALEEGKYAKARIARGTVSGTETVVVLPETFMNESGNSVSYIAKQYEVSPEHIAVVYDDVDLPIGEMRISFGRGDGGHNGVKSVVDRLGTKDFTRVRVGVAPVTFFGNMKKPPGKKIANFVLKNFTGGELRKIEKVGERVKDALTAIVTEGHEKAMNTFN